MGGKKIGVPKNFALAVLVAVAVMLVIVFGYNTFSRSNSGRPTITEFSKEPSLTDGANRSALKQPGAKGPSTASPPKIRADLAKAVLNVRGVACSSCIQEIKDALSSIQGIEEILVDISRGTAQIYYDGKILKEPDRLA
jgi:copper chaperone CopZ